MSTKRGWKTRLQHRRICTVHDDATRLSQFGLENLSSKKRRLRKSYYRTYTKGNSRLCSLVEGESTSDSGSGAHQQPSVQRLPWRSSQIYFNHRTGPKREEGEDYPFYCGRVYKNEDYLQTPHSIKAARMTWETSTRNTRHQTKERLNYALLWLKIVMRRHKQRISTASHFWVASRTAALRIPTCGEG